MDPVAHAGHGNHHFKCTIPIRASEKDNTITRNGANGLGVAVRLIHVDCISKIHVEENGKPRTCHLAWYFSLQSLCITDYTTLLNFYIMKINAL